MDRFKKINAALIATLVLLVSASAWAQVSDFIPLSGTVRDSSGSPVRGAVELRVGIWDDAVFGSELWFQEQKVLLEADGFFAVYLGQDEPIDDLLWNADELWLEIRVGGEPSSRVRLGSAASAVAVRTCRALGDLKAEDIQPLLGQACEPGTYLRGWDQAAGQPVCGVDEAGSFDASAARAWAAQVCFDNKAELTALLSDDYAPLNHRHGFGELADVPDLGLSAGAGVEIAGDEISLKVGASGTASTVARSDHDHAGVYAETGHEHFDATAITSPIASSASLDWSEIEGIPAGFADGRDDVAPQFPNLVRVRKGESIQGAIDAIADASAEKTYLIKVDAGTFNEQVILKPYLHLQGAGRGLTRIVMGDAEVENAVTMAQYASLRDMTVESATDVITVADSQSVVLERLNVLSQTLFSKGIAMFRTTDYGTQSNLVVRDVTIRAFEAMSVRRSAVKVSNCDLFGDVSGVYCGEGCDLTVSSSALRVTGSENKSPGAAVHNRAIAVSHDGKASIANSTLINDCSVNEASIASAVSLSDDGAITVSNSDLIAGPACAKGTAAYMFIAGEEVGKLHLVNSRIQSQGPFVTRQDVSEPSGTAELVLTKIVGASVGSEFVGATCAGVIHNGQLVDGPQCP